MFTLYTAEITFNTSLGPQSAIQNIETKGVYIYLLLYCRVISLTTVAMASGEKKIPQEVAGSISQFDQAKLKRTSTDEKNPLPSKEGKLAVTILTILLGRGSSSLEIYAGVRVVRR